MVCAIRSPMSGIAGADEGSLGVRLGLDHVLSVEVGICSRKWTS
jgi:hypothetical protein